MASISARSRLSISSRPDTGGGHHAASCGTRAFDEKHLLHVVDFLKFHFDDFVIGGLHGAADVARFDGQFAMAAIDQNQQLHARRTAVIEKSVERRADGAAGVKHVVHQDDFFSLHGKRDIGAVEHRLVCRWWSGRRDRG